MKFLCDKRPKIAQARIYPDPVTTEAEKPVARQSAQDERQTEEGRPGWRISINELWTFSKNNCCVPFYYVMVVLTG